MFKRKIHVVLKFLLLGLSQEFLIIVSLQSQSGFKTSQTASSSDDKVIPSSSHPPSSRFTHNKTLHPLERVLKNSTPQLPKELKNQRFVECLNASKILINGGGSFRPTSPLPLNYHKRLVVDWSRSSSSQKITQ